MIDLVIALGVVMLLISLSAIVSGLETAFTAASRAKIQHKISKGNLRAKIVAKLRENMGSLISTFMVLETIIEVSATSLLTVAFTRSMGEKGALAASVIMSILIVIYGEVLPKIYAFNHAEKVSIRFAKPSFWIFYIFSPLAKLMENVAKFTLKLFRSPLKQSDASATIDELRGIIQLHATQPGAKTTQEGLMLESILDLSEVSVDEIMTHRKYVNMINCESSATEILEYVLSSPYTRHPVWRDNRENIVGVLHTKDLLRAFAGHKGNFNDIDILQACSSPWFIPESSKLLVQLQSFKARKEHLACVVDEYGALLGIVTLEDILEEIVGPIDDEHDITLPGIKAESKDSYIIYGWVTLRDIEKQLGVELPDEHAATLAGFVIHEAENIPDVGQIFHFQGLRIEILKKKRNQITKLRVSGIVKPKNY